jgi:hypothetical protein
MLNQNGLTEGRSMMDTRTAIGVTTCSDFEVEGAVYLLFLLGRVTGE